MASTRRAKKAKGVPPRQTGEVRRLLDRVDVTDEELLDLRFCDLGLRIEPGSRLDRRIGRLHAELAERGLRFRPHCWLSDDWFSPEGIPGIAVPFFLAHPRLAQLESRQMCEVEGGTKEWCLRLLRHEAGHAIDTAFRLRRRRRWRELFGNATEPYPESYKPRPYSKQYVLHLGLWYSQSHPTEDFAETFAVWLRPGSGWKKHYRGWPALKKLEYVDELMRELRGATPPVRSRRRSEPLSRLRTTLREYYRRKRARYQASTPEIWDRDLRRVFTDTASNGTRRTAAAFLRRIRPDIRRAVSRVTGQHAYTIDQVLEDMMRRCRELGLRVDRPESDIRDEVAILLSFQTANYLHSREARIPL